MKWTKEEKEFLSKNSDKGSRFCYLYLNRTKHSVISIARKMNIKFKSIPITDETKNKISRGMRKAHRDGRHKGWAFINGDKDRRSYPEKFFLRVFDSNEIFKKYTIKEKYSYGKYFVDFLIVELKLVIEVDGDQHYRTKESIDYDVCRDNYFLREGFKVYRLKWSDVYCNTKEEIEELIRFVINIDSETIRKYDIIDCVYRKVSYCECGGVKHYKSKVCLSCKRQKSRKVKNRPDFGILQKEVEEFGYCAVGRKYGVSDNAIRKWLK
jgi:very-short-patch-repair endonuclease